MSISVLECSLLIRASVMLDQGPPERPHLNLIIAKILFLNRVTFIIMLVLQHIGGQWDAIQLI